MNRRVKTPVPDVEHKLLRVQDVLEPFPGLCTVHLLRYRNTVHVNLNSGSWCTRLPRVYTSHYSITRTVRPHDPSTQRSMSTTTGSITKKNKQITIGGEVYYGPRSIGRPRGLHPSSFTVPGPVSPQTENEWTRRKRKVYKGPSTISGPILESKDNIKFSTFVIYVTLKTVADSNLKI